MADSNEKYQDMDSNKARVMLSIATLVAIVLIVLIFVAFGNLGGGQNNTIPPTKEKVAPPPNVTNNTTKNYYYNKDNNSGRKNKNHRNDYKVDNSYSKRIADNGDETNNLLKKVIENTGKTANDVAVLKEQMSVMKTEVAGIRTDMNAGFAKNHDDMVVLNNNVVYIGTTLRDLGPYRQAPGSGRNGNYWDGNKNQPAQKDTCVSNPGGWKQ